MKTEYYEALDRPLLQSFYNARLLGETLYLKGARAEAGEGGKILLFAGILALTADSVANSIMKALDNIVGGKSRRVINKSIEDVVPHVNFLCVKAPDDQSAPAYDFTTRQLFDAFIAAAAGAKTPAARVMLKNTLTTVQSALNCAANYGTVEDAATIFTGIFECCKSIAAPKE